MLARETNTSKMFLVETAYPPLPHSPVAVVDLEVPSGVALINVGSLRPALDNSEAEVPFVLNVRFESGREPQPGRRDIEGYGLLRRKFGDWAVEWASPVVGGERLYTRLDKGGVYFTGITGEDIYYAVCPDQRQLNARMRIGSTGVVQKRLNVTGLDRMTKLLHAKKPLAAMLNQL